MILDIWINNWCDMTNLYKRSFALVVILSKVWTYNTLSKTAKSQFSMDIAVEDLLWLFDFDDRPKQSPSSKVFVFSYWNIFNKNFFFDELLFILLFKLLLLLLLIISEVSEVLCKYCSTVISSIFSLSSNLFFFRWIFLWFF